MRKYNGVYKLPIKKHTPVRRPVSRHITLLMDNTYNVPFDLHPTRTLLLVKDISIGLENPLRLTPEPALGFEHFEYYKKVENHKPSLLTRVKERFGRGK